MVKTARLNFDLTTLDIERIRQGLNYRQLAERCGMQYNQVYQLLSRPRKTKMYRNVTIIKNLCNTLNVNIDQVVKKAV
ncbi:MAG: hypothetical protein HZA78_03020 [Candidatus Schekmanbacteria bacterium]|nr:hypothetical protein [Candidatus Schekmanbacteria bacterium]